MRKFGLIGKNIAYSFSRNYFKNKFFSEEITDASYENFDINSIEDFISLLKQNPDLKGLNVTIPYKETIIPYLDKLSKKAKKIKAVNTIKISKKGKLIGYNTDCFGFKKSLKSHLKKHHKQALILGTGGASKAIKYALKELKIKYLIVSRNPSKKNQISYSNLTKEHIQNNLIIINCTPIGTFPNVEASPNISYNYISNQHILYDLVYNPLETTFLKYGKENNATCINGITMLEFQAEKAWEIWNK